MIFLLTLFNVLFTLFGVLDVKLTGLFWLLDTTVKKSKEYHKLWGNDYHSLSYLEPTENGAVVLKIKIQIDKTSDKRALEEVDYLVSEYRYKEIWNN